MSRVFFPILAGIALWLCSQPHAHAGAWTQKAGDGLLIQNYSFYRATQFVNNGGKRQSQPTYRKLEWNPYLEYGLTDTVTVGANLFVQYVMQDVETRFTFNPTPFTTLTYDLKTTEHNVGIGDTEWFVRKRLWQKDGLVFSAEPMIKLPALYAKNDFPDIGNNRADAAMTFSTGYSFKALGNYHFSNLDVGYRYRFGPRKDQLHINATLGITLDDQWTILPQAFITRRMSSPRAVGAFTETPANDYNLTRLQLSTVYKMWDDTAVQVGGFYHASARNSSTGGGVMIALWESF